MVATDVAAEKATELPRLGKPRMKLNVHASHTGTTPKTNKQKLLSASWFRDRERTNRYGSGNASAGRLCVGTWSLGSRRRG